MFQEETTVHQNGRERGEKILSPRARASKGGEGKAEKGVLLEMASLHHLQWTRGRLARRPPPLTKDRRPCLPTAATDFPDGHHR